MESKTGPLAKSSRASCCRHQSLCLWTCCDGTMTKMPSYGPYNGIKESMKKLRCGGPKGPYMYAQLPLSHVLGIARLVVIDAVMPPGVPTGAAGWSVG